MARTRRIPHTLLCLTLLGRLDQAVLDTFSHEREAPDLVVMLGCHAWNLPSQNSVFELQRQSSNCSHRRVNRQG